LRNRNIIGKRGIVQFNRIISFLSALSALWLVPAGSAAQDFLLEGCFWQCAPGDEPANFVRRLQREAPQWKHAGFTGVWLPEIPAAQTASLGPLTAALRAGGIEPLIYLPAPAAGAGPEQLLSEARNLRDKYRARSFNIGAGMDGRQYAAFLKAAIAEKAAPRFAVADPGPGRSAQATAAWINAVYDQMTDADASMPPPRALDRPLRDALHKAMTDNSYDARSLFSASLRDATSLTGFNAVTFVNASFLPENEPIADPMPAYAYILLNNQLGLPMVHIDDYRDPEHRDAIDQLLQAHRQYIVNSIEVEYLNRPDTDRRSIFLSAPQGADERRAILFQMEGRNTPAGRAHPIGGSRDVLAAINFSDAPLKVIHELNPSNLRSSDRFHDVLGLSDTPELTLDAGVAYQMPNAVYIELPPRSYSIWVQGETGIVLPGEIRLSARRESTAVELSWEAAAEPGLKYFELERSTDGGTFETVEKVAALPAAGETAYLYLDENTERGRRYAYRVKAVNEEGYFFSPVVRAEIPAERMRFDIVPGNGPGERLLQVRSNVEGQASMRIIDNAGKVVFSSNFALKIGEESRRIPVEALKRGVYHIDVKVNGERMWAGRMVKL